jgi:hypothetical protein
MSPIFWSSEPITAVPFNLDASSSSLECVATTCGEPDTAGAVAGPDGACASAVGIINPLTAAKINPLTAAKTTNVLLMTNLLTFSPVLGESTHKRCRGCDIDKLFEFLETGFVGREASARVPDYTNPLRPKRCLTTRKTNHHIRSSKQKSNHHEAKHGTGKSECENVTHVMTGDALSGLVRRQHRGGWRLIIKGLHLWRSLVENTDITRLKLSTRR